MRDNNTYRPESTLADTRPTRPRTNDANTPSRAGLETLLHQARTASNSDTALEYMQRAVDLQPDDPRVLSSVQLSVFNKLRSDAYLAFLAETDGRYVIQFRNSRPFTVPKARNEQQLYPPARRTDAERASSMMWWMILGLVPAGLGAIILSPFAIRSAVRALQHGPLDQHQYRTAWMAILIALVLGLLGVFFAALLLLHFMLG